MSYCALKYLTKWNLLVIGAYCLFWHHAAWSDPSYVESASSTISLSELIKEALEQNYELKSSKAEATMKASEIGPVGSYSDPTISVEAMNYPVDSFKSNQSSMTGVQLSLSQDIPFPGKLSRLAQSAKFYLESQNNVTEQKTLTIIRDIKIAYYSLMASYQKKESLLFEKKVLNQVIAVARNNYALNKLSQAEIFNLQVEEIVLSDQLLVLDRTVKELLGTLNHKLGRTDQNLLINIAPRKSQKSPFDFNQITEQVVFQAAMETSPEIKAQNALLKAANAKKSYTKLNYLPDFTFKVGYTFRKQTAMDRGEDFASAMVAITVPLWSATKQSEEKNGAVAEEQRATSNLYELKNRIAHDIHTAYAELEEASKRISLYEGGALALIQSAVASAQSGYATGKVSYSNFLSLLTKRTQIETQYYESMATYESKIAEIEALIGKPISQGES